MTHRRRSRLAATVETCRELQTGPA
jgi:hypothetical protein